MPSNRIPGTVSGNVNNAHDAQAALIDFFEKENGRETTRLSTKNSINTFKLFLPVRDDPSEEDGADAILENRVPRPTE